MNKIKVIFIFINLSLLTASLKFDSVKVGIPESLGVFGLISVDFEISSISKENDVFYFTLGTFPLPIFGGAGLTYKKYFNSNQMYFISNPNLKTMFLQHYSLVTCWDHLIALLKHNMATLGLVHSFSI